MLLSRSSRLGGQSCFEGKRESISPEASSKKQKTRNCFSKKRSASFPLRVRDEKIYYLYFPRRFFWFYGGVALDDCMRIFFRHLESIQHTVMFVAANNILPTRVSAPLHHAFYTQKKKTSRSEEHTGNPFPNRFSPFITLSAGSDSPRSCLRPLPKSLSQRSRQLTAPCTDEASGNVKQAPKSCVSSPPFVYKGRWGIIFAEDVLADCVGRSSGSSFRRQFVYVYFSLVSSVVGSGSFFKHSFIH